MEIFIKAAQFFLSLSILVLLHEFGHFAFARLFNTRVEKFYIFFDAWFSVFKFKKGDTEYGMGWLPLGGYVKISGMIDESMDKEQMKQPPKPYEFRSKPAWQRLLIMTGGVLVNFILALVIYASVLYVWGEQYLPTENAKYGIMADSVALEMGLKSGDKIVSVDGEEVEQFFQIMPSIVLNNAKTVEVMRNGEQITIPVQEESVAKLIKNPAFISVRIPFIVQDFTEDSQADEAGMEVGDKIVAINGDPITFFDEFKTELSQQKGEEILVTVSRDGEMKEIELTVPETGLIGVYPKGELTEFFELEKIEYGFFEAIPAGIDKGITTMKDYLKQFKLIFSPKTKAYESLGGFITIGSIFPGEWNWQAFWTMTAFLSIILAIMNMLPIPALDGGHVMFLFYEIITGRKPGDKFMEYAQIAGMVLLLSLLLYANGNDIVKLFNK